jgi:hypothetical protein
MRIRNIKSGLTVNAVAGCHVVLLGFDINAEGRLDFAHCGVRDAEFGLRKSALKSTFPPRLSPEMALSLRLSAEASAQGA